MPAAKVAPQYSAIRGRTGFFLRRYASQGGINFAASLFFLRICRLDLAYALPQRGALSLADCLPEQIFDLSIDASQFCGRPSFQLGPKLRIDPEKIRLSIIHRPESGLGIERAGIHHGMHFGFAAKYNH